MHNVSHTLQINVPPEKVWSYLADASSFPEWNSTCQFSTHLSDGPININSKVRDARNLLGVKMESTYEVTELVYAQDVKSFSTRVIDGPVPFNFKWTMEHADDGTRLTGEGSGQWTEDHEDEVIEAAAQRALQHDMENIKHLLETR
jgi:hypothetical protein